MERFLLDTHIWIWLQDGNRERLKRSAIAQAQDWHDQGRLHLSAISVWEVGQLAARQRITLSTTIDAWVQIAMQDPALSFLDLSVPVLLDASRLPGTLHKDPADRMLIATARHHGLTLLTRDEDILTYGKQRHVKVQKF